MYTTKYVTKNNTKYEKMNLTSSVKVISLGIFLSKISETEIEYPKNQTPMEIGNGIDKTERIIPINTVGRNRITDSLYVCLYILGG